MSTDELLQQLIDLAARHQLPHLSLSPLAVQNETPLPEALRVFPLQVTELHALKLLNLNGNCLRSLPPEIGALRNLTILCLQDNGLEALPDEIQQLKALMTLDLRGNNLRSLPIALGWLPRLQNLLVEGNPLTDLPPDVVKSGDRAVLDWVQKKALQSLP